VSQAKDIDSIGAEEQSEFRVGLWGSGIWGEPKADSSAALRNDKLPFAALGNDKTLRNENDGGA
jgi:hypothetical protein